MQEAERIMTHLLMMTGFSGGRGPENDIEKEKRMQIAFSSC
jgi:hypothetical protein